MFKAKQQLEKGKEKKGCSSKTDRKNTLNKVKGTESVIVNGFSKQFQLHKF